MSLEGQVAVVTGSASGIGRACAVRLARDGADVALLDIDEEGLAETSRLVEEQRRQALSVAVDLLDRTAIAEAFERVRETLGAVSVLHNNAGGSRREGLRTFAKASVDQWDYITTLNLRQVADCSREVVNDMIAAGYGRIINTSSEMAFRTNFGMTEYSTAKAGLLAFTRSLANEVARHQITVNAVCPGVTKTDALDNFPQEHLESSLATIPLGRFAEPEEIAHAVSFFASPQAGYVTGESLLVTGGRTMR
ncbi:MAG: SDR family oxidoreductase [Acidobacteriota bacterium]